MSRYLHCTVLLIASILPVSAIAAKNIAPTVSLTAPVNGASFSAPATITLSANASDPDGSIAKVEFYRGGTTLIGTDTTAPYTLTWANVAAGSYTLTAKATDSRGAVTTSAAVNITVTAVSNTPPSVVLALPTPGTRYTAPAEIALSATASDSDDAISKLEFFQGSTLLGTLTAAPYSATWSNVSSGSYTLTARATDSRGAATTSAPVNITVGPANLPPLVAITAPAYCGNFDTVSGVGLDAQAVDPDGNIVWVDYYAGTTLIGSVANAAPYRDLQGFPFSWAGMAPGTYTVTARATDNLGASTVSAPITLTIAAANQPPQVILTAPASGAVFSASAPITITADASDSDGRVSRVDFYRTNGGWGWLGAATAPPYTVVWNGVKPAGQSTLLALATDNRGAQTQSASVSITISTNSPPSVNLTEPVAGATFCAPAAVQFSAVAADSDGSIARVEFFQGSTLIGTATSAPYAYTWTSVASGNYTLTAKAIDDLGASTVSSPISVAVYANAAPSVSLTAPAAAAVYYAPASITLSANAADSDGSVSKVDFYNGATLLGTVSAPPYRYGWSNVAEGTYNLTAKATDNLGAVTASVPLTINVKTVGFTVDSPIDGTTLTTSSVLVSGAVQAPPNSGITVNGIVATFDNDGHFYANAVPLTAGTNTLTATLTTPDNQQASQSLTVNYAPQSGTATISGSPLQGLAPLTANFTVTPAAGAQISKVEVDYTDDGSIDSTLQSANFALTYATPGTYRLRLIATDTLGNVTSQVFVIQVLYIAQLDTLLRGVYTGMLDRLRAGDINGALVRVTGGVHDKYAAVFNALGSNLPTVVDSLGTIQSGQIIGDLAEYLLVRDSASGPQGFLIYFLKGEDGVWRIDGM